MSEDDKYKVWIDYMVTHLAWEIEMSKPFNNLDRIKSTKTFDEFCVDLKDKRIAEYLDGWYWRFKDRIFKDK